MAAGTAFPMLTMTWTVTTTLIIQCLSCPLPAGNLVDRGKRIALFLDARVSSLMRGEASEGESTVGIEQIKA